MKDVLYSKYHSHEFPPQMRILFPKPALIGGRGKKKNYFQVHSSQIAPSHENLHLFRRKVFVTQIQNM